MGASQGCRRRHGRLHRLLVEALRVGDMRRVLAAYLGFSVAEMANFIAILIYAYEVGGSPALGLVVSPTRPGRHLFAPVGATLGDRYRREVMLTVAYALFAASSASVAIALYADWPVGWVYFLAAVNATVLTLVRPFHESLLPPLARSTEQLTAGMSPVGPSRTWAGSQVRSWPGSPRQPGGPAPSSSSRRHFSLLARSWFGV